MARPNIILVYTDQQRYDTLGANGNAVYLEHGGPGRPLQPGELSDADYAAVRDDNGHHLCDTVYRGRSRGIVTDHWKYICTAGGLDELYDLAADPHELRNLSAVPQHAATIRDRLLTWAIDTEDISALA